MPIPKLLINAVLFVASTAYQLSQQKKMKAKQAAAEEARKGFDITQSGVATNIPLVYGKQKLGGINTKHITRSSYNEALPTAANTQTFSEELSGSVTGEKNEFLFVQTALCYSGIESVVNIDVNDIEYDNADARHSHRHHIYLTGGVADPMASANGIPATNTFTNTAYSSAVYKLDRDDPQYSGIPSTSFYVKGMKVRKITESSGVYTLNSTYEYTNNPAYCLLDYLLDDIYGRGLTVAEVDLKSFYDSAQVCDTVVSTGRSVSGLINDTSTRDIPLYECNIALDTAATVRQNINLIMDTMGMSELTWTTEGKYKLSTLYPTTGSETQALVDAAHFFTDDDVVRSQSVTVTYQTATQRKNLCTVSFLNEHEDFKSDTVTWPTRFSATHTTYLGEDNGLPLENSAEGVGITDPYHATALAEQLVRKSRTSYTLSLTVTRKGLTLEPGDLIKVDLSTDNISDFFRVESMKVLEDLSVELTCYQFEHTTLAWNVNDDIAYAPRPVYDFVIEPPRDLSFSTTAEVLGTGSGNLSWNAANGSNIRGYVVEMSADNGVTYEELGRTSNNKFDVTGLQAGVYTFSVRSYTISTALSARAVLINNTIQLKTVGKVAVIYADTGDTATNNQSYNLNSNTFVGYYEYDGDRPTLPIRSNLTFSEFIGPPGADGDDGSDGARGAGWWRYETGTSTSVSGLTTSTLNTFFATATGLSPSAADRFIVVNTNDEAVAYLRSETNSAWIQQADFLDGDLLVNGTVTAEKLTVTNLEAISANIGTLRTATTGQRMELRDNKILVYDSSNVLRVKIGDLS